MCSPRRLAFPAVVAAALSALSTAPVASARAQGRGAAPRTDPAAPPPQTARPAPRPGAGERGVIARPLTGPEPEVRPPATGEMPVIPPPGSSGGDRAVVPK